MAAIRIATTAMAAIAIDATASASATATTILNHALNPPSMDVIIESSSYEVPLKIVPLNSIPPNIVQGKPVEYVIQSDITISSTEN